MGFEWRVHVGLLQCYTHNNLGWKIHVVEPGYISQHNGNVNGARTKNVSYVALTAICLLTLSAVMVHMKGRIF